MDEAERVPRARFLLPLLIAVIAALAFNAWVLDPAHFFFADDWGWLERDAFTRFGTTSDGRMGRDAPSLAAIDDALKKIQQVYSRVATAKGLGGVAVADDAGEVASAGGQAVAGGGGGVALDLGAGSLASKEAALRAITEIAGFFRRTEPHNPVAYLLDRAVYWANMPLEQWLAEVVRDESTLSSIRERVGLPPSY